MALDGVLRPFQEVTGMFPSLDLMLNAPKFQRGPELLIDTHNRCKI